MGGEEGGCYEGCKRHCRCIGRGGEMKRAKGEVRGWELRGAGEVAVQTSEYDS